MTNKTTAKTKGNEGMLTLKEGAFCRKLAALDKSLATQRATALLALDEGITRAEAAAKAGLTVGQLRYLLARFRLKRLEMFADEILSPDQPQEKEKKGKAKSKKKSKKPQKKKKKAAKPKKKAKKKKAKGKDKKKSGKSKKSKKKKGKTAKKKSKK